MDIAFHGHLDEATYARHVARHLDRRLSLVVAPLVALVLITVGLLPNMRGATTVSAWFETFAPVVTVIALLIFFRFWIRRRARKKLLASKILQGPMRGTVSERGVHLETDYSSSNLPWDVFHRRMIKPDLVVLYTSPANAILFPRPYFGSDSEWQTFCSWAEANVSKSARR